MGKHILSQSFHTVSHIKKTFKLHKNGKGGVKKLSAQLKMNQRKHNLFTKRAQNKTKIVQWRLLSVNHVKSQTAMN